MKRKGQTFTNVLLFILLVIAIVFIISKISYGINDNTSKILNNSISLVGYDALYRNYKIIPTLNVYCDNMKELNYSDDYFLIEVSFQSQCAIVNVNPNLYNNSFKEYHVCFIIKNQSIGDC